MSSRLRLSVLAVVSVAVLLSGGALRAQALPFLLFERYLDPLRIQAGIPGLSALILQDDQVVWERAFGYRDVEASHAATPDTPYAIADLNNPGVKAMNDAMEAAWGTRPFYRREGGSIGAVAMLQQICGVESVLVGMGLPSDNVHSPNEHLHLPTWRKGIDAFIHFFNNLG